MELALPVAFAALLREDEVPVVLTQARIRRGRTGGNSFLLVWVFVWAADAIRNRQQTLRVRSLSRRTGAPLDRKMEMLVTSDRMMVRPLQRTGSSPVGDIPREDIAGAVLPYTGGGKWRTVEVHFARGYALRFSVESRAAAIFVDSLNGT